MTITPMPVLPAASRGSSARAADAKPGKTADDFAAVLDGQLNGAKTALKADDAKEHPSSPDAAPADVPTADAQAAGAQPGAVPAIGLTAAPVEALQVAVPVMTTAAPATSTPSGDAAADAIGAATVALPATPGPATDETADPATPHQPAPSIGDAPAQPEAGEATADPATPHQPTPPTEPLPDLALVTIVPKAPGMKASTVPVTPEQPEPSPAAPAAGGVAAPATPAAEAPATGPTQPTAPTPVLGQVTPALARVVTRGDGEHRMMLKLHPADLGEIHLTVTVRGEHVDVEIAAGAQARDLLRDGSAHLRSMLESIGRSTGQLVLRDLPSTPVQPSHGAGLDTGAQQDGRGTSYAGTDDSRRDRSGAGAGNQPQVTEHERPVPTRPASARTTVTGASALDVTV